MPDTRIIVERPPNYAQVAGMELTRMTPFAASQVIARQSGKFVKLDANKRADIADDGDGELYGWAVASSSTTLTTSSTAGVTKLPVCVSFDAFFMIPIAVSGAAAARTEAQMEALVGEVCDLVVVSDIQYANVDQSDEDTIQIVDWVSFGQDFSTAGAQALIVRMNPNKFGQTGVV